MGDDTTIDELKERVALLETLVERLTFEAGAPERRRCRRRSSLRMNNQVRVRVRTPLPRRHLLGKAGVAAVGAVLGGTIAAVGTASPASAATGSFDTSTSAPALTATTTDLGSRGSCRQRSVEHGNGDAMRRRPRQSGAALNGTDRRGLDRRLTAEANSMRARVTTANGQALYIDANGTGDATGLTISSERHGALISAAGTALWAIGDIAVEATGGRLGLVAAGSNAQMLLAGGGPEYPMEPPTTRTDTHDKGELYFDRNGTLWVCTADGTPGTWSRIGGAGTAGAFTVLPTPVRVYDTRPTSTRPGGGTGPVTGTRHGIDLTANSSGLPTDATAAMVTLTVLNTQAQNNAYGQIYADALTTPPTTSVVNWTTANQLIATTTTTALTAGKVAIAMNPGANVLIDVLGYWR